MAPKIPADVLSSFTAYQLLYMIIYIFRITQISGQTWFSIDIKTQIQIKPMSAELLSDYTQT